MTRAGLVENDVEIRMLISPMVDGGPMDAVLARDGGDRFSGKKSGDNPGLVGVSWGIILLDDEDRMGAQGLRQLRQLFD